MRGDDAAGVDAVRWWQGARDAMPGGHEVRVETIELPGLGLLEMLDGLDAAILVDSIQTGAEAGTVRTLALEDLEAFARSSKTAHGWGVAESLRLGLATGAMPGRLRVRIVGIEGGQFELGRGLSNAVRDALPPAAAAIEQELTRLLEA